MNTVFIVGILVTLLSHDFHVSRCEVVYRSSSNSLEVTQHMFVDDIELALKPRTDKVLNLCTDVEEACADSLVAVYLRERLTIAVGKRILQGNYLGKEPGEDPMSMWAYIEFTDVPEFESLSITYDLLFEVFDDQKNILSFRVDSGPDQMFLLDESRPNAEMNL